MYKLNKQFVSVALGLLMCQSAGAVTLEEATAIQRQLVTLDTHLDTPANLVVPGFDILERHSYGHDFSQVDVPRMQEGALDGGFWAIYSPQGELSKIGYEQSRDTALLRALAIRTMVTANPEIFEFATQASDAQEIKKTAKHIVYMSMENSYPLGTDISLLETFYKFGLRMTGPVHFKNNQFGDSSTDPDGPKWDGLSPLGEQLVVEANRLGIVLDGSHAHDETVNPERKEAFKGLMKLVKDGSDREIILEKRREIEHAHPAVKASFEVYMKHFLHALKVVGPEHVGIGADWDGGGGVDGMMDVVNLPMITQRLLDEGYSKEDLANIWGANALRVLQQAQDYAANVKAKK